MEPKKQPTYEIAGHEILAETPELRMVVLTLAQGQEVPRMAKKVVSRPKKPPYCRF